MQIQTQWVKWDVFLRDFPTLWILTPALLQKYILNSCWESISISFRHPKPENMREEKDVLDIFMAAELKEVMVKPLPSLLVVLFYSLWHLSNPECIVCKWTCQPSGLSQIKYIHHHPSQIKARIDWNSANPRAPRTIFNPLKRRESRMFLPNLFTRCAKESWQTFYYNWLLCCDC